MQDQPENRTKPKSFAPYLYLFSSYFVGVGTLYLWGYWGTFNINILQYLSFSDVVKYAAYPIASIFIFTIVGIIYGHFIGERLSDDIAKDTAIRKSLRKNLSWWMLAYLAVIFIIYYFGPKEKWIILPLILAIPAPSVASKIGLLSSIIPTPKHRSTIILILAALPGIAYGQGVLHARSIIDGEEFQYIVTQTENNEENKILPNQRIRFIGHAGSFVFLLNPKGDLLIIANQDAYKIIELKLFKKNTRHAITWGSE